MTTRKRQTPAEPDPQAPPPGGDDDEAGDAGEAAGDQTPAQAAARDGSTKQADRLEAELARFRSSVDDILGPGTHGEPCPTCDGFGFVVDGFSPLVPLVHHPDTERCDLCGGRGQLETGSLVHGAETLPCPKCGGDGYTHLGAQVVQHPSYQPGTANPAAAPAPPAIDPAELEAARAILRAAGQVVIDPYPTSGSGGGSS